MTIVVNLDKSASGRKRIFVVDDEPIIASTLSLILCGNGFDAIAFTKPVEALEAVLSAPPDLVISDVYMPGLSGIELAIRVRAHYPECRVILFSGQMGTADLLSEARERGHHFEIIAKPVHPKELLRRIESAVVLD
jgi:CheY-like chemotaxis protein